MRLHANHRTCPSSRRLICERVLVEGWTLARAAEAAGCSERTAAKWLKRFREGDQALVDRSSRPWRSPTRLSSERVAAIEALRRLRMTAGEIAEALALALSTVSLWLKRLGLGKRSRLDPIERPTATNDATRASSCTSTSRSWGASRPVALVTVCSDTAAASMPGASTAASPD